METQTSRKRWVAEVGEGVPLRKQETNRFAWRLRRYLEERILGLKIERIAFLPYKGEPVLKTYVKTERRRPGHGEVEGAVVDIFEDIGGPEIRLYVNEFHIATWMQGADRLTTDMLDKDFEEFAQVAMLAIIGTWEFHNTTLCCEKWGADKSNRIDCCDKS